MTSNRKRKCFVNEIKQLQCVVIFSNKFLGGFTKLRKVTISYFMSACPSVCLFALNNSAATERIFMKLESECFFKIYLSVFRKSVWEIILPLKSDKNYGTLHEDQYTFLIISC